MFDAEDWLPDVDPADYDPDLHRNRHDGHPYGDPRVTRDQWCRQQARNAWTQARLEWCRRTGGRAL